MLSSYSFNIWSKLGFTGAGRISFTSCELHIPGVVSWLQTLSMSMQGEIFAAEGWGKVTGEVGVCIATSGPGATNLVTGLADALLDSVPLVAITGQVSRFAHPSIATVCIGTMSRQGGDSHDLYS